MQTLVIPRPKPHKNQEYIIQNRKQFNVVRCGRRFGKTILQKYLMTEYLKKGLPLAYICLDYSKNLIPVWEGMKEMLAPIIKRKDEQGKILTFMNNCNIDFWSIEGIESMRGRKYYHFFWDEAAADKKLEDHFEFIVRPTLIDYDGGGDFNSTPKGYNYFKTLDEKSRTNPKWQSFHYTSYDGTHKREVIEELIRDTPAIVAQQEYLAEYVDVLGAMIKREHIKYSDIIPNEIVMAVDLAISQKDTADYTAIAVIGKSGDNIHILDIYRGRISFIETQNVIESIANKWNPRIIGIESVAYQSSIVQELTRKTTLNIASIKPDKDKVTRFHALAARYEQGLVYHNKGLLNEFEQELLSFPESQHDDMIDAISYAYSLLAKGGMRIWNF